jgi:hypothetical protein
MAAYLMTACGIVFAQGPGLYELPMHSDDQGEIGIVSIWNSPEKLHIKIIPNEEWAVLETQIYVGVDPVPVRKGRPYVHVFPFKSEHCPPAMMFDLVIDLQDDLGFSWGANSMDMRVQNVAVHGDFVKVNPISGEIVSDPGTWESDSTEPLDLREGIRKDSVAFEPITAGVDDSNDYECLVDGMIEEGAWAHGPYPLGTTANSWYFTYELCHPQRGHFIDSPVFGLAYDGPTQHGITTDEDGGGGFTFFPDEYVEFSINDVVLGTAMAAKKISPLDLYPGSDIDDPRVIGVARVLQTLDNDQSDGKIIILPEVAGCFSDVVANLGIAEVDYGDSELIEQLLVATVDSCNGLGGAELVLMSAEDAKGNLLAGLSASGIFRKNVSKTEDWGEGKQKLEVMPVYLPGSRSDGSPSFCDLDGNGIYDEGVDQLGVPYEEWRLGGDPAGEECDPRDYDDNSCELTLIECREVAKPILTGYLQKIDIFSEQVTTEFWPDRFSSDVFAAVSRDDGTTWKRMNVSRMADLSSFDLLTGEPFPGTCRSPQMKVNDNQILAVWTSTFCKSGNPRYAIETCDDPETPEVETPETGCQIVCRGDAEQGTEICEPDYPYDDEYYVTDIWGVRGHQQSVDYDEVDDVAELGIGEIPYSCLWSARGVIVTQADLDQGRFNSLIVEDDPTTPDIDESRTVVLGDIIWFKPERLTSARRDAYIPVVGSARGAGFAIAWQEDPEGLRPGKGKGPGQGWSGAISNHKTDIWYSFIRYDDFAAVDENFVPGGPPDDGGPDERPGLGRPKAMVPFSLPIRISDNDMVNTDTLKVDLSSTCVTPPGGTEPVCFPTVVAGENGDMTFMPIDPEDVEHGNAVGTKRYAYMARSIDDDGDGVPDYQYYEDRGGTLDLCDTAGTNSYMDLLPGTSAHERWFGFVNTEGSSKLVCTTSDGRLLDGDVSASRPNINLQPYTRPDGSKGAWVLLSYEESKGMGHPHADDTSGGGQVPKPIKQDYGKNVLYHTFEFTQPDLVAPGHIVNLPALCGGIYPTYCEQLGWETGTWDPSYDAICTCEAGQPIPLYFETKDPVTGEFVLTEDFQEYRHEVARRARFIVQGKSKLGDSRTLGSIIYKQGQEGQGRPADVFIRRFVAPPGDTGNPYKFENLECQTYLDQTFPTRPGYHHNVWGEPYGDRLCGGLWTDPGGFMRRDHVNLTSADIDLSVDAGPEDDTPDDPTDDIYGTDKVLLWSQHDYNIGDESYGHYSGIEGFAGMFSNARSHRGFIRGDFLLTAYAYSPNWAAGRNGNDRYNFYIRKSFDGGQTWTTNPEGVGVHYCREWRTDPTVPDEDGTGNAPPVFDGFDPECVAWCAEGDELCVVTGDFIGPGEFEPARNVSEIKNNKETSADPRVGATPPQPPLDGRAGDLPVLRFIEDYYVNNVFFLAWGTGDNVKSTGGMTITPEATPLDVFYSRTTDFGDTFYKVAWNVNPQGNSSNWEQGELVWRYDFLVQGEEEQGECQLRATPDGSKMYSIYHQMVAEEGDPDEPITRWYPWEPEVSHDNDIWFRRVIFSDDPATP